MLRNYQTAALEEVRKELGKGVTRQLIVLPTGAGKTVVFSNLYDFLGLVNGSDTMLVLAHREELIQQAADKMKHWNPTLKVGIEMGEQCADVDCNVVIASVATLGRKGSKRIERFSKEHVKIVVTDEAHHATSASYTNIYQHFGLMDKSSKALLLGVTATPSRGDGQALSKVFDKVTFQYTMRQAIEDGWLTDIRGFKVRTKTNLDDVATKMGDFEVGSLSQSVNTPQRNQIIVKAWQEHGGNRQTVVFTVDIQHAKDIAETFKTYGVVAEAVWGDDPDRAAKLARHRSGETKVIANCGILTEGYDDSRISCIVLARPTKSQTLFVQCAGRGVRIPEGIRNLKEAKALGVVLEKEDCILIDVVDATDRHSLVTLSSIFGMNPKMDLKGKSVVAAVKKVEQLQLAHQSVDFSKLEDLDRIQLHIEEANLWEVKFPAEIENNSELCWFKTADGAYGLLLPNKEQVCIRQNMLDQWEITAIVNGKKFKGVRDSLEAALHAADGVVDREMPEAKYLLSREQEWHEDPMTDPQRRLLERWYKNKPLPADLSKGQADKLIKQFIARKTQGIA